MTTITLPAPEYPRTSAGGSVRRSPVGLTVVAGLIAAALSGSATANTYAHDLRTVGVRIAPNAERTAAGPEGQLESVSNESTAEAVMEIRRRSGLTLDELGELFGVSRRSIHHWANGKRVASKHDQLIRRVLAAVRRLDRGDSLGTRALLLSVDNATGESTLELLRKGQFDDAMGLVEGFREPAPYRIPLSRAALGARRSQVPVRYLGAEQERPDTPANARTVRVKRAPTSTD